MRSPQIDQTHDPALRSWVASASAHPDFPIQNLPLGMFSSSGQPARPGVAIGDEILDLRACNDAHLLPVEVASAIQAQSLNVLLGLPNAARRALRHRLSELLSDNANQGRLDRMLSRAAVCSMHLPATIGDYTDFYAGIHHANNVGRLFRPDSPLLPNYKFLPIGYHGRASSVRPSGTPVTRPNGQTKLPTNAAPEFGPTKRLDYELELGIWIGAANPLGASIAIEDASMHIAGYCLVNDWSARDIQAWEYQPLGPFLAKSFQTTISPWIITAEAMAPFMSAQAPRPVGDPRPLDYLWSESDQQHGALNVMLEVYLRTADMRTAERPAYRISQAKATELYWTAAQLVAHHSSNGCNLNPGDLLGSGTISSSEVSGFGSLLELTRAGSHPITLPSGESRQYLEDGDEISLQGHSHRAGYVSIGFGECVGQIVPRPQRA